MLWKIYVHKERRNSAETKNLNNYKWDYPDRITTCLTTLSFKLLLVVSINDFPLYRSMVITEIIEREKSNMAPNQFLEL